MYVNIYLNLTYGSNYYFLNLKILNDTCEKYIWFHIMKSINKLLHSSLVTIVHLNHNVIIINHKICLN
jgi:hypothetical protein